MVAMLGKDDNCMTQVPVTPDVPVTPETLVTLETLVTPEVPVDTY